jgi:hypothetical protein
LEVNEPVVAVVLVVVPVVVTAARRTACVFFLGFALDAASPTLATMPMPSAKARITVIPAFLLELMVYDSFRSREIGASPTDLGNPSETAVSGLKNT